MAKQSKGEKGSMGEVHDRFRWHFPRKLPFVLRLSFGDPARWRSGTKQAFRQAATMAASWALLLLLQQRLLLAQPPPGRAASTVGRLPVMGYSNWY
jgi:hypothetical protein